MELIIKPTGRCNFACSFCSANLANIKHSQKVPDKLKEVIEILKPDDVVFTGGDPLMVPPSYYEEFLSLGDFTVSFTTNLKDFYFHPEKWREIFKNPRLDICTSFQYGSGRKWDKDTVYTEEMFIKVMTKFKEEIGHMPPFIAVISKDNEDRALDHLRLAKKLGTQCKMNGLLPYGLSKDFYPLYKMIDIWKAMYESELSEWWDNSRQFFLGTCNFNTNLFCESTLRTFWLNDKEKIVYSNCEDCAIQGKTIPLEKERPIQKPVDVPVKEIISPKCLSCDLFRLCNACKSMRKINKMTPNHCAEMKKRESWIKEAGWKL